MWHLDKPGELSYISVMTETTGKTVTPPALPPAVQRFVLHWGEMGAVWGVNRSIGQIHAVLYLSDRPMTAEDLADTLGLARSNVSTSIKELLQWGLIRRVSILGDRRDFFEAEADLWEMVSRIAEGRKARELDPTIAVLHTCAGEAQADRFMSTTAKSRITEMLQFCQMIDAWAGDMRKVPRSRLMQLVKLGSTILRFIPGRGTPKDPAGA